VRELRLRVPSPVELLTDELLHAHGVRVLLKRDDLIHPDLSGSKWRKLEPNLAEARCGGYTTLLTFGGAYSNHLLAVAAAGYHYGFEAVGVVRGEQHLPLNDVLARATGFGMRLTYLDRETYRRKQSPQVLGRLRAEFGECYVLPEGGSNALAVQGCAALPQEIALPFDVVCCAVGTGGTLAGLAGGLAPGQHALGFAVLRGGEFLTAEVASLQQVAFGRQSDNWRIETRFHEGGYAKRTPRLDAFIAKFDARHGVQLNWVYEAKMMFGLFELIGQGAFPSGATIVVVLAGR
jgi:1-aminocyclopropane-1-carboxylate deaminase